MPCRFAGAAIFLLANSGEQNLEISVDGERVRMFTLPATPEEDLNIERQVFKAPGTKVGRVRQPRVDANGDPLTTTFGDNGVTVGSGGSLSHALTSGSHDLTLTVTNVLGLSTILHKSLSCP